ncbi:hypothetical protein IAR50_000331 [Cryptococcus sp. DSM 104548]
MQHIQGHYDAHRPSPFHAVPSFLTPTSNARQPSTNFPTPSSPPPSSPYRSVSARDVFLQGKGRPVATASDKIMAAVKDLGSQISDLHADVSSLKCDNTQLRDQLHELQLNVRCLPSRDEVTDEIINNMTPALQECLQSGINQLEHAIAPISNNVVKSLVPHLDSLHAECNKLAQVTRQKDDTHSQPLRDLLSHVIAKLGAIETIGDSVQTIHSLSQMSNDITLCRESLASLQDLITTTARSEDDKSHQALLSIRQSVQDLCHRSERSFPRSSQLDGNTDPAMRIHELLTLILSGQNELRLLLGRLSTLPLTSSSSQASQRQNLTSSFPGFPTSSQHESRRLMATPVSGGHLDDRIAHNGLGGNLDSLRAGFSRRSSTQHGSSQSSLTGDRPLVGNSLADIFGPKSFIPGPVRPSFDTRDAREESWSHPVPGHVSAEESDPPLSTLPPAQATLPGPSTHVMEAAPAKKSHKKGKTQKGQKKKQPTTTQPLATTQSLPKTTAPAKSTATLLPSAQPCRQTRQSSRRVQSASGTGQSFPLADADPSLSSRGDSASRVQQQKGSPSVPRAPDQEYSPKGEMSTKDERGSDKGKKRTWDFSSDEED